MPRSIGSDHGPLIEGAWITKIDGSVSSDQGVGMNGMYMKKRPSCSAMSTANVLPSGFGRAVPSYVQFTRSVERYSGSPGAASNDEYVIQYSSPTRMTAGSGRSPRGSGS